MLAWIAMKLGDHARSRRFLANIPEQDLARMPVRYGDLGLLCQLAEIYEALADAAGARELYARLLPHETRNGVLPSFDYCGAVARYLGILARMLGHHDRAAQHFARAEVLDRRLCGVRATRSTAPA